MRRSPRLAPGFVNDGQIEPLDEFLSCPEWVPRERPRQGRRAASRSFLLSKSPKTSDVRPAMASKNA